MILYLPLDDIIVRDHGLVLMNDEDIIIVMLEIEVAVLIAMAENVEIGAMTPDRRPHLDTRGKEETNLEARVERGNIKERYTHLDPL